MKDNTLMLRKEHATMEELMRDLGIRTYKEFLELVRTNEDPEKEILIQEILSLLFIVEDKEAYQYFK